MTKRIPWITTTLFLLSFFIRFSLISKGPYHTDSLTFALTVEQNVTTHKIHFMHLHGYPFTTVFGTFFFFLLKAFGINDPVFSINLLSVLCGAFSVPLLYAVGKKLFNPLTGLIAAFLFSVTPIFLSTSIYGNSHTFFLLLALITLNLLLMHKQRKRHHLLFGAAVFWGLAGAARVQDMGLLSVAMGFLFFMNNPLPPSKKWQQLGLLMMASGAIVVLFYIPIFLQKTGTKLDFQLVRYVVIDPISDVFPPYYLGITLRTLTKNFSFLGIAIILAGLFLLLKSNRDKATFLLLWFFVPMLIYGNHFMTTPRWLLATTASLAFFQGYCLEKLITSANKRVHIFGTLVFFSLCSGPLLSIYPTLLFRHQHALTVDFARWVAIKTEPQAVIIVGDEGRFIRHYGNRATLFQISTDTDYFQGDNPLNRVATEYKENLDRLLANGTPVYVTEIGLFANNTGFFSSFLTKYFHLHLVGQAPLEAWHRSCIDQTILPIKLYKITKISQALR